MTPPSPLEPADAIDVGVISLEQHQADVDNARRYNHALSELVAAISLVLLALFAAFL
jgi:hypothetical protein